MNSITMLVFKKELIDIFRDRKTLIIGILIPLLIFPVMFGLMGKGMKKNTRGVEDNLKIAISDEGNSTLGQFIRSKNVNPQDVTDMAASVKEGKIFVGIEIPKNFDGNISSENMANVIITYDNSSEQGQLAFGVINGYINEYSTQIVGQRLTKRNIDVNILTPIMSEIKTATKESEGFSKIMLSMLLPLMLVIYSVTGPLAAATDLGAGEKERGTLEPLLTTQASRMSLLWGKFLAITVMGLLSAIASIGGMFIAMTQNDGMLWAGGQQGAASSVELAIEPKALLIIGLIAVLITMVFGALELSISIYARSFKEAQTYLSPLTILAIIPTYATYMLDAKNIDAFYFHIPLANAVCIIKELIAGIFNPTHMLITIGWILVYIIASILFARYMFSKEEVIFRT